MRLVGPILYFRGQTEDRWSLSVLVVLPDSESPLPLETSEARAVLPQSLDVREGHRFWRYDFSLPLRAERSVGSYALGPERWTVHLPPLDGPFRLAYTACSGTENDGPGLTPASHNALWRKLEGEHAERPFHLLLQGGDQLYADTLWPRVPELAAWRRLPWDEANAAPFTASMARAAGAYYHDRYVHLLTQPELASVQAVLPSVMMWDDHDIFDGWGSWPEDRQASPVFQGLYAIARTCFALFQLCARPGDLPPTFADSAGGHFGCSYRLGPVGIIAPDLRAERSRQQIMGPAAWRDFEAMLAGLEGCRHLLVMSSVPLTNADLTLLERIYTTLPGHSDLEDDLRDQWQSFGHREEWRRMLACLIGFAARTGARVTGLSGEIHLGALGVIEGAGLRIFECTASGIVHPPPPWPLAAALGWVARTPTILAPDLRVERLKIPGHGRRYLRARNWLALDLVDGGFEAAWHTEHGVAGRLAEPPGLARRC